jgi:RimJ/RimL family protein N-acetyltransferase
VINPHEAVIETQRLRVRPPQSNDAQAMFAMAADWEVAKQTASVPHPYELTHAQEWIGRVRDPANGVRWVVERRSDEMLVGVISIGGTGIDDFGYWFGRAHWGQGYATEAATAVADFAIDTLEVSEVKAGVFIENLASARVLEKAGFTEGETFERTLDHRGGLRQIRRFSRAQKDKT